MFHRISGWTITILGFTQSIIGLIKIGVEDTLLYGDYALLALFLLLFITLDWVRIVKGKKINNNTTKNLL